jgi:hypothetical protein
MIDLVPGQPVPGVVVVPAKAVHIDIQQEVATMLKGIEPGKTMAVLNVRTGAGVNLAVAHKFNERWQTQFWIGKAGWQQPIEGGVTVAYSR